VTFPKIELHVHLEGTVRAATLLDIARRNDVPLPADTVEGLRSMYEFTDFRHFLKVWGLTTGALRTARDFSQVVVDYAAEAARHGAVYLEGIISPSEHVERGCSWDEVMTGFCDGAEQARELHGVHVRLTPDVNRSYPAEAAELTARHAVRYADRGVVGLGLGGPEAEYPPEPFARAFAIARDAGLGSVPHAGEAAGPASIRGALDALHADRIRHGIRAAEDAGLVRELADRGIVLDVCPVSNLRTKVVAALAQHPLPALVAAGVPCSVSTDDPAMFDTDLTKDYAAAAELGVPAAACFEAGLRGALCDDRLKAELAARWPA
jgi:aminodeoxyfutalosine deaminase